MKEKYFTLQNIDACSQEMISRIKKFKKTNSLDFCINRSALLILDMQKYFLNNNSHAFIPSSKPIIKKIIALVNLYYKYELPVIFTRHIDDVNTNNMMKKWWNDSINRKDISSNLSEIFNYVNATIIEKQKYDAFYQTDLDKILKKRKVKQLVICGVMTHLCCDTTARSAFVRDYEVFFLVDCTATYNKKFHFATLLNLSHGVAKLVLSKDIKNAAQK